ncbi:hypothetical protein K488DRAFT_49576 [Vararia minispora EC-137]|uniref:Uncharacterized protein n=1 Tax=Vararia minispora EC-137 TaxID=1314806 RepID=A0ACB8QLN4_9AGAM|nr:hypothetical protein K488DRAFT_49576 [Vararia minispora EC-137]
MPRRQRTIVLCFDGTSDQYSSANTNVVKLCSLLEKDNERQVVYYQARHKPFCTPAAGIGTYISPSVASPPLQWCARILDEAFAIFLATHVMQGYKFLMQNFNIGDRVCLFGFSRGAYTARALAGMLHKVGLLGKDNNEQVPFAYKLYKSNKPEDAVTAAGFKQTFCREVPIDFVGVWDTVSSVGVIVGPTLPFVQTNNTIRTFRHALSLDEHRAKFRPSFYVRSVPPGSKSLPWLGRLRHGIRRLVRCSPQTPSNETEQTIADVGKGLKGSLRSSPPSAFETDVKEVWFAGCHSDVGGGNALNTAQYALANIPLRWMVREVMQAECSIAWEETAFAQLGIPFEVPGPQDIQSSDAPDAEQKLTDELVVVPAWWLLEIVPTNYTYQDVKTNKWVSEWSIHLGRGRWVPESPTTNFHSSVKQRMDNVQLKYEPRARYKQDRVVYTD